ncbi:hypothetical protein Ciccas_011189 [Cichlidogyrus casuarinus]|uniref:G-protein coupled receptors family 1 profile domain-containing protein n=1 Tax=Cichlidogyrus casuarinus TaxID=1844966 RepID=A0ABD2PT61_9PLAT
MDSNHTEPTVGTIKLSSVIFAITVIILVIVGCLGNGAVIYILMPIRKPKPGLMVNSGTIVRDSLTSRKSVTGVFLLNLAISDILSILLTAPSTVAVDFILESWPFGKVLCYFNTFLQGLVSYLSGLTHVSISLDRLAAIYCPIKRKKKFTVTRARLVILFIWFVSAGLTGFYVYISSVGLSKVPDTSRLRCGENWEENDKQLKEQLYNTLSMMLNFALPLIIMSTTYSAIICKIWSSNPPGVGNQKREAVRNQTKKKVSN